MSGDHAVAHGDDARGQTLAALCGFAARQKLRALIAGQAAMALAAIDLVSAAPS